MPDDAASAPLADDTPAFGARPVLPLGVGGLITDCFRVFLRHILVISLIGVVPMILGQVLPGLLLGAVTGVADAVIDPISSDTVWISAVMAFLLLAVYTLTTAILIQLAHDEQLGHKIRVRRYLGPAFRAMPAMLALGFAILAILVVSQLVLMLFAAASSYLLVTAVPFQLGFSLWILGVYSVSAPAVLFEKAGLRGLLRSAELTRDYRWAIVGALVLISLLILVFYLVVSAVIFVLSMLTGGLIAAVLFGLLSTSGTSILAIAVTLIYLRLRELKDGIRVDQIAAVFD